MRTSNFLLLFLALGSPAVAQKQDLGIFQRWGAFAEPGPRRCYAVAEPQRRLRRGEQRPFASVGYWPGRGAFGQIHFRLRRDKREGSAVLLRIDDRLFQLVGGGANAWAPDPRADAAIVAAMRRGLDMTIETRAANGARLREHYPLRGAASAIDAAAIACAPAAQRR